IPRAPGGVDRYLAGWGSRWCSPECPKPSDGPPGNRARPTGGYSCAPTRWHPVIRAHSPRPSDGPSESRALGWSAPSWKNPRVFCPARSSAPTTPRGMTQDAPRPEKNRARLRADFRLVQRRLHVGGALLVARIAAWIALRQIQVGQDGEIGRHARGVRGTRIGHARGIILRAFVDRVGGPLVGTDFLQPLRKSAVGRSGLHARRPVGRSRNRVVEL